MTWLTDILDNDRDPKETQEWLESLKAVLDHDGPAQQPLSLSALSRAIDVGPSSLLAILTTGPVR